jgi:hypothetical protein
MRRGTAEEGNEDAVACAVIAPLVTTREMDSLRQGQLGVPGATELIGLLDGPDWPSRDARDRVRQANRGHRAAGPPPGRDRQHRGSRKDATAWLRPSIPSRRRRADFVRVLRHQLFVTATAPASSAKSMFASLDRTPLRHGSEALTWSDAPSLVGAPWILPLWCVQFPQAFSPAGSLRWCPTRQATGATTHERSHRAVGPARDRTLSEPGPGRAGQPNQAPGRRTAAAHQPHIADFARLVTTELWSVCQRRSTILQVCQTCT